MIALLVACSTWISAPLSSPLPQATRPNVILVMADDLGYGDVGFLDGAAKDTPHLDRLAGDGVVLSRFYAAAPVCSPTRASFLTGRHPSRMGVNGANEGHLPHAEITIAERLRDAGYATGFFGKWHLGTLTREVKDSNRGGREAHLEHYTTPQEHGFETVFATEAKVPTYDPMVHPDTGKPYGTRYWDERGSEVQDNLAGDDSRVILDRALDFIDREASGSAPFLAVVWFHAPHLPVVASPAALEHYADQSPGAQAYRGSIHDLDAQVGRLRARLEALDIAGNTMIAFCSDNGPEGAKANANNGSTAGLRGRKRSLYEGGVRVPAFVTWPEELPAGTRCAEPASTSDWMATVLSACGESSPVPGRPSDGTNLLGALRGEPLTREAPIGFLYKNRRALVGRELKWIQVGDAPAELYDLAADPFEESDLAAERAEEAAALASAFEAWAASCRASATGIDYGSSPTVIPVSRPTANQAAHGWRNGTDWLDQHEQSRAIAAERKVRVALFGDSITQGFGDPARAVGGAGREAFDEYLAPLGAANYGISGDRTQHVLWRLEHGALEGAQPESIVLEVGTTNLRHNSAPEIAAGVRSILDSLARRAPQAKVLLLGLFPRGAEPGHPERAQVAAVNALLAPLAERYDRVSYHDLGGLFLTEDGHANPERMAPDCVHLAPAGYRAWGQALAELLQ